MKTDGKHLLINGKFEPADAKDILLNFINHKINYNEMKNFSSQERFGKPDKHAKERVTQLKEMRESVLSVINEAIKENKFLRIESTVKIGLRKK